MRGARVQRRRLGETTARPLVGVLARAPRPCVQVASQDYRGGRLHVRPWRAERLGADRLRAVFQLGPNQSQRRQRPQQSGHLPSTRLAQASPRPAPRRSVVQVHGAEGDALAADARFGHDRYAALALEGQLDGQGERQRHVGHHGVAAVFASGRCAFGPGGFDGAGPVAHGGHVHERQPLLLGEGDDVGPVLFGRTVRDALGPCPPASGSVLACRRFWVRRASCSLRHVISRGEDFLQQRDHGRPRAAAFRQQASPERSKRAAARARVPRGHHQRQAGVRQARAFHDPSRSHGASPSPQLVQIRFRRAARPRNAATGGGRACTFFAADPPSLPVHRQAPRLRGDGRLGPHVRAAPVLSLRQAVRLLSME